MSVPPFQLLPAGDTALLVELGESIDRRVSTLVLALAQRLRDARLDGLIETVPTFRSLLVHYDPLVLSATARTGVPLSAIEGLVRREIERLVGESPKSHELDVVRARIFAKLARSFERVGGLDRVRDHRALYNQTARMILVAMMISLTSCRSGVSEGNTTSKADITDPNISFSRSGSPTNAP